MGATTTLHDQYNALRNHPDRWRRGREFELLVGELFELCGWDVTRNPRAASPRQTDLVVMNGETSYLVETKWRRQHAGSEVIDAVRARLERIPPTFRGLVISVSGFTAPAYKAVVDRRDRPILLLDGEDLDRILIHPDELDAALTRKWRALVVGAAVDIARPRPRVATTRTAPVQPTAPPHVTRRASHGPAQVREPEPTPPEPTTAIFVNGKAQSTLPWAGGFNTTVFAPDLPDIDWVPGAGHGVTLDLVPRVGSAGDLTSIHATLSRLGWVTSEAHWSIHQSAMNWHGIGAAAFTEALQGWELRYRDLDHAHHRETFTYFDVCEGGYYTLTGDVSADARRRVSWCALSVQLTGVPLDTAPLRQLAEALRAAGLVYFRPRDSRSLQRGHPSTRIRLKAVALVAQREQRAAERWVSGVIAENPFARRGVLGGRKPPADWPAAYDGALLMCDLRSHHYLSDPPKKYFLEYWDQAWTSDALVFRPVADW